jgi:hypothetical protein
MSTKFKRMYCKDCETIVKAENTKEISHMLHIFLTIITGGLWIVVYGFILGSGPKYTCSSCGSKRLKKA